MIGPLFVFRILCINGDASLFVDRKNPVGLRSSPRDFHAGRTDRHAWDSQTDNVRLFPEQPQHFILGDVPFNNVAIDDGRVTGVILRGNAVLLFELIQFWIFNCVCLKAEFLEMITPALAATSAGGLVNFHEWQIS